MRLVLRNQNKIKKQIGSSNLVRILRAMHRHQFSNRSMKPDFKEKGYDVIIIEDIDPRGHLIHMYIVNIKYDVYTLAFKEFIV